MKKLSFALLLAAALMPAHASVQLSTNRLICYGANPDCTMTLKNGDDRSYLIQSWVDTNGNTALSGQKIPFVVTPPLFRMSPKSENVVQLVYNGAGLPQDRESLLWLNVKSIPAVNDAEQQAKNKMLIAVSSRIKVFWRPQDLPGSATAAVSNLHWEKAGVSEVRVVNNSAYYVVLNQVSLNGKEVKVSIEANNTVIPPKGNKTFRLREQSASVAIKWSGINDFSAQSETFSKQL